MFCKPHKDYHKGGGNCKRKCSTQRKKRWWRCF